MAKKHDVGITLSAKDKTKNAFRSVQGRVDGMVGSLGKARGAILGIVGAAGMGALVKSSLDYADAIAKASEKTGFATDTLQELRFAADQTGVSVSELDGGLARFTKRVGLARMGTGAAAATYKQLGIDLSQTNEQVFKQVTNTLAAMDDQTNRLALTTRLFGDDAQKLELTLRGGTQGLDEFAEQARELGLVMDEQLLRNAEEANDKLSIMSQVIKIQAVSALVELAPVITDVGNAFASAIPYVRAFADQYRDINERSEIGLEVSIRNKIDDLAHINEQLAKASQLQKDNNGMSLGSTAWAMLFGADDPDVWLEKQKLAVDYLIEANAQLDMLKNSKPLEIDIGGGSVDTSGGEGSAKEDEAHNKYLMRLQKRLDALQQTFMTERELEVRHMEDKQIFLDEVFEAGLTDKQGKNEMLEDLEKQHQDKLNKIQYAGMTASEKFAAAVRNKDLQGALSSGAAMTAGVASHSKKMFKINKALALANAMVKLPSSVMSSFDNGGGYPWGLVPAGMMLAVGMAEINAIRSTSFGGGGVVPSLAGSGATSTVATVPASGFELPGVELPEKRTLSIQDIADDEPLSGAAVRRLLDLIKEAQDDGYVLA